jgi:hypothetical protein
MIPAFDVWVTVLSDYFGSIKIEPQIGPVLSSFPTGQTQTLGDDRWSYTLGRIEGILCV